MTERQAVQPAAELRCRGGRGGGGAAGAPAAAAPLPAVAQRLLQRHALELRHEIGDGRQQAGGGRRGARSRLVSVVAPVSGGGAKPVLADDAVCQQAGVAAAQRVLLRRRLDQVGPAVVQRHGQDVELVAARRSLQAVLGRSAGRDAGERCVLPVLHLLQADVVALVKKGTNGDGVAELFELA